MCAPWPLTAPQALGSDRARSPCCLFSIRFLKVLTSHLSPTPPPPPPTATPTVQTCALEGKTVRSNVDALDHLELVVYLVSAPVSFITNLNYLACPCGFPAVPGGALAHSLGTIKTMVGMALEFHLLRVSSMAVLPSLLPVAVSKILAVVQIILKPWGQPISPHSNLYDSTARDLITL